MNTSHKLGLASLLLGGLMFVACNSDDNASPSDDSEGGTHVIKPTGGTKGEGGDGSGGDTQGTGGKNGTGGDIGPGGSDGTGGTFDVPDLPECNADEDLTSAGCWDISGKFGGKSPEGCNAQDEEQFLNQCSNGGFCGDDAFDNEARIENFDGKLPALP